MDPATKKQGTAGVEFDGWKSCDWRALARWYNLGILAGTPTLAAVQDRRDLIDFKPMSIGNRRAVQFNLASDDDHLGCGVAVEVPGGTVIFDMLGRYGEPQQEEPCTVAVRHASDLVKYLPNG